MPSVHTGEAEEEIRLSRGLEKWTSRPTSATGLRVSITHLTLSRAPSHVFERLIVAIASSASLRALSAGDTPASLSVAGGIGVLGRRSVGGESVSEPVATVDRVVLVESLTIYDVASTRNDLLTSVDWKLATWVDNMGLGVVFGDTMTVK